MELLQIAAGSAVGHRTFWQPRIVLVAGAGPIGLLAAFAAR
jgi:threonine dehydrogenase-like Zn-dependent dehydrogenase